MQIKKTNPIISERNPILYRPNSIGNRIINIWSCSMVSGDPSLRSGWYGHSMERKGKKWRFALEGLIGPANRYFFPSQPNKNCHSERSEESPPITSNSN